MFGPINKLTMPNCLFCSYDVARSDVLRKHMQRHHTVASVTNPEIIPRIAEPHPTKPNIAILLKQDGTHSRAAYCFGCFHEMRIDGYLPSASGGVPGWIDRHHGICKEKQVRQKRIAHTPSSLSSTVRLEITDHAPVIANPSPIRPAPISEESEMDPFKMVVVELLSEGDSVSKLLRKVGEELEELEEDSDSEDIPQIEARDILVKALRQIPIAEAAAHKAVVQAEPMRKALSEARARIEDLEYELERTIFQAKLAQEQAAAHLVYVLKEESKSREAEIADVKMGRNKIIMELISRLSDATGETEEEIADSLGI